MYYSEMEIFGESTSLNPLGIDVGNLNACRYSLRYSNSAAYAKYEREHEHLRSNVTKQPEL
jgi:hypothetical protein